MSRTTVRSASRESRLWFTAVFDGTGPAKAGIAAQATRRTTTKKTGFDKRLVTYILLFHIPAPRAGHAPPRRLRWRCRARLMPEQMLSVVCCRLSVGRLLGRNTTD